MIKILIASPAGGDAMRKNIIPDYSLIVNVASFTFSNPLMPLD